MVVLVVAVAGAAGPGAVADPVPAGRGILVDQQIRFRGPVTQKKYPGVLRRVVARTAEGKRLEFLTNHLTLGASTVARIYKDRWQIELFFKALKQHRVDIPRDSLNRKQSVLIPGFLGHFRDVDVTKVENGMKTREVISGSRKR